MLGPADPVPLCSSPGSRHGGSGPGHPGFCPCAGIIGPSLAPGSTSRIDLAAPPALSLLPLRSIFSQALPGHHRRVHIALDTRYSGTKFAHSKAIPVSRLSDADGAIATTATSGRAS